MPARSNKTKPGKRTESILHRDIKELEIGKNLRRLGNIRVTEWEFSDMIPAVNRLAHKEVHIGDMLRRTANYRVTEWDLADLLGRREQRDRLSPGGTPPPTLEELLKLSGELGRFVRLVTHQLIDHPDDAEIKSVRTAPDALLIKLVLVQSDAAALIGHGGHTAAALRNIVKDVGRSRGARVNLRIQSWQEASVEGAVA